MSIAPVSISPAIMWFACWLEPHCESIVVAPTVYGRPVLNQALRVMFKACSPACVTQPPMIWSIVAGSTPARSITSVWAFANNSIACSPASQPLRFPIGVRTASMITASGI